MLRRKHPPRGKYNHATEVPVVRYAYRSSRLQDFHFEPKVAGCLTGPELIG